MTRGLVEVASPNDDLNDPLEAGNARRVIVRENIQRSDAV
jgi:hypothetical protein